MSWENIRREALEMITHDNFIAELVQTMILDHDSFGAAISHNLSHQFADIIKAEKWQSLFLSVYKPDIVYHEGMHSAEQMGLLDLIAVSERDPACDGLVTPFLYFKGYKAIQCHRIAHILWHSNRKNAARAVQSRCSELYGVDIHPAAVIGK
jgi:serine O-acetyltransferase